MIYLMFKRILLIINKLITLYEYLITLIHQEYNYPDISIYFLDFLIFYGRFLEIKIVEKMLFKKIRKE